MIYDLSKELDRQRLGARLREDFTDGVAIEYTRKVFKTPQQNRYLHLLVGVVAMEVGVSIEYAKAEYFKRLVNPEIFVKETDDRLTGRKVEQLASINDVPRDVLSKCIDKFKMWGRDQGWKMPDADEQEILRQLEIEIGRQYFL